MISCILLVFLIGFYRTGEMSTHGKLSKDSKSFFGDGSWVRKYKDWDTNVGLEERWFTSTTLTVFLTDFYHLSQFIWLKLLCAIVALNLPFNFWISFFSLWVFTSLLMWTFEQIFSKK